MIAQATNEFTGASSVKEDSGKKAKAFWRKTGKNKLLLVSSIFCIALILAVILAPLITSFNPNEVDLTQRLLSPGEKGHFLGTDGFGRDLFARILYGGRTSLGLSVCIVVVNATIGLIVGTTAAFLGGVVDGIIMRIVDILMAFPNVILSLFIVGVFGASTFNLFISLIILGWIGYARMSRSLVLSLKEQVFIQSSSTLGCSKARIIFTHLIPNVLPTILIYGAMHIGSAILSISSISFLGLGVQPPTAEWGSMLSDAKQYVSLYPHMIIFPGIAIASSVLIFNIMGDGVREFADPHAKKIIKT